MQIYYRISDKSYPKLKLPGTSKKFCFDNFKSIFNNVTLLADNCEESLGWLKNYTQTNLGNAGALFKSIQLSLDLPEEEIIYFVEDDYIHSPKSHEIILEAFEKMPFEFHYLSLYDHPDKYEKDYQYGEISKVTKTKSSHWKTSISTCMTFATKVKYLKEDLDVWRKYTSEQHPHDHYIFSELREKGKILLVSIPGLACHIDLTYSAYSNNTSAFALFGCENVIKIEPWAIEEVIKHQEISLDEETIQMAKERSNSRFEYLVMLDAFKEIK